MVKILQANLNHARQAQDLFVHNLAERGCGLGIIAEPYEVPRNHAMWMASSCGRAAITWWAATDFPPCTLIEAGEGYVAVQWGRIVAFSVYLSPALDVAQFARRLDRMGEYANRLLLLPSPVLIAGNFNAKSRLWGSPRTDGKGNVLTEWAAELGLSILNSGTRSTCVRPQGQCIVDLTWVSPLAARLIEDWTVVADVESVRSQIHRDGVRPPLQRGTHPPPRG